MTRADLPSVTDRYSQADIDAYYKAGLWRRETLFDVVDDLAERRPDDVFATDGTTALTFGELRERAYRLAVGLSRSGIEAGDRVVIQLPNWTDFVVAAVGVTRRGAIVVPIMPIYRHEEVKYVLQHSGARAAITCESFNAFGYADMYADVRGDCPDLGTVYLARASEPHGDARPLATLQAEGELNALLAEMAHEPTPDDGHIIIYTSGTTARPKGCFHTWNTLAYSMRVIAENSRWSTDDVAFGPSPVTHATGYVTSVLIPLLAGGKTHLMEAWNPAEGIERIAGNGCTATVTATAFLQMLLDAYDPAKHDLSSMRLWIAAGSPIPAAVIERAKQVLPSLEVLSLYGRSENMLTTMCKCGDDVRLSLTSDGCAPPDVEIAAVDMDGNRVSPGEEGDLCYKGPGHMIEYFRQPDITAEMFTAEGLSRSGDLGRINEDGYLRVTGRLKDIIIRGGMNISALEVENLLLKHPAVANVAVVAMPDERLGEKACAFVVPADGATPNLRDLSAYLRDEHQFAIQKMPERLEIVDTLPMTATGKVQKHVLRSEIAAVLEREAASA